MCVPAALQAANIIVGAGKTYIDYKNQSDTAKYRTQIALNNIKSAQDEAKRQIQLGIDKSREEKIEGIRKASALLVQNGASNSDAYSDTNYQNYDDINNIYLKNAQNIQDEYNQKADKYFEKAYGYLNQYNSAKNSYRSSIFKGALNSLGNYNKVAQNWYSQI